MIIVSALKKLLFIGFLAFPFALFASHMIGEEITYKWLGNKKYEVTAKVYRECRGIPLNSPVFEVSDHLGNTFSLNYSRTSIEDITLKCMDSTNGPCNPQNTTVSNLGIELHTFVSTVDFSVSPFNAFQNNNSCKIYFSIQQCCRGGGITTMSPGNYYVDAMLDICNSKFQNTSPRFRNTNTMYALCNLPYNQNFGANDFSDFDSLAYELTDPMNDYNTPESFYGNFSKTIPMTPYCSIPGVINCNPSPKMNPPRGFYFNKLNGDIVFTPTNCSEVGVIAVKISEYRKDSANNKWLLIGYVIRDVQVTILQSSDNLLPTVHLATSYNFRTRQNTCIDIETKDTPNVNSPTFNSNNKGDKSFLSINGLPSGATFRYVDSSAYNKTGRLCWNVHDSVYLKFKNKDKLIPLTVDVWDNFCYVPGKIQSSFFIKILPPDSSGFLTVNTFIDVNKNSRKDGKDPGIASLLKFKDKSSAYYVETDDTGALDDMIGVGKVNIGIASHPYFSSPSKDTNLLVKMDSTHHLDFIVKRNKGIYGRIYEDANANCVFDNHELPYSGFKVYTDSNKFMGITDKDGIYLIDAPKGNYTLSCDYKPAMLKVNCPTSKTISVSINGDSAYLGNDFGISKNMQYSDISTGIDLGWLTRGNVCTVTFYCMNNGPKTRKNIKLYCPVNNNFDLTYNSVLFAKAGTTAVILIDSIQPYKKFTIKLDFYLSPTYFAANDNVCFTINTDTASITQDSVKDNNTCIECRKVNAPYDPNEKLVSIDSSKTMFDKSIAYTIHFQNTGTDTATRVMVVDTIDTKFLEISKFNMNWSDFPCQTIITGNIIHFIFDGINLPFLSASGDASMAGFNFTLGLKSDWPVETSFVNKAAIHFDFEDPVITANSIATINSPLVFTGIKYNSICSNDSNVIQYKSNIPLNPGNQLILELSDSNGSFILPVVLSVINTTNSSDSIRFSLPGSFSTANYTLRLRSTNPASISIPGNGYIALNMISIPDFTVNSNLKNNAICENDTLNFQLVNSGKPYQYQILRNNINTGPFSQQNTFRFRINASDSFKIRALDNTTGCSDSVFIYPTVFQKPLITAGISNRKKEYCQGDQIEMQAGGGAKYIYKKSEQIIENWSNQSFYKTMLDSSSIYSVYGEDTNGCRNISDTILLKVNASPPAIVSSYPDPICAGDSVLLYFGNMWNYDLYRNNVQIISKNTAQTYKISNLINGDVYRTVAYSKKGCSAVSNDFTIVIHPVPPVPHISINLNEITVSGAGNFKWYRNGILLSDTGNTISNAPGGIYRVIVTNSEGCSTSSKTYLHKNSGLIETQIDHFKIYPNPATQNLTIENLNSEETFTFSIYNMNGKLMLESSGNINQKTIDIGHFSSGLYNLRIEDEMGDQINKMINIYR